ncbi:hypothetical protein HTG_16150 [Natrinema mahii]|nr:hypothetical protein HTG_16150 [Natrinema mahii]
MIDRDNLDSIDNEENTGADMNGRRTFLTGLASTASLATVGSVAAEEDDREYTALGAAEPGNKEGVPVEAKGTLEGEIQRYNDDVFVHERTFRSEDLAEHFGDPVFEEEPVYIAEEWLSEEIVQNDGLTYTTETTKVIGTSTEHNRAEAKIKTQRNTNHPMFGGGLAPQYHTAIDDIPLYNYSSKSRARRDPKERTSPTNLAFKDGDAAKVGKFMEDACGWTSGVDDIADLVGDIPGIGGSNDNPYAQSRYLNYDGDVVETDRHVMNRADWRIFSQVHIRLYDVSSYNNSFDVVGQVHRDPEDHNKVRGEIPIDEIDWRYNKSRSEVRDCWENNDNASDDGEAGSSLYQAGRGGVDTHDGKIAAIVNDGFEIPCTGLFCGFSTEGKSDAENEIRNQKHHSHDHSSSVARPCACMLGF